MFTDHFTKTQTPFICLRGRLSQVWLDSTVCVFVLYIVKLIFLKQFLSSALELVEDYATSTCGALENAANVALNAQSEAVDYANSLVAIFLNEAIAGAFKILGYTALAAQQLIIFFIEITIGTWACLTVTLFGLAANESLDLVEGAVGALNTTVISAANDIADFIGRIEDLVNDATGLISSITSFVTGQKTLIKQVNTSLDSIRSLSIPSNITTTIESLRNDIPTYDDAKDALTEFISTPFTLIRNEIDSQQNTTLNLTLPSLPSHSVVLCNYNDISHGFDDVDRALSAVVWGFIGLCIAAIVGTVFIRLYFIRRRWIRLQNMALDIDCVVGRTFELQKSANMSAINFGIMTGLSAMCCDLALKWNKHTISLLWYIQYVFSDAAISVLYLGIMGAIITVIEYVVLYKFRSLCVHLTQIVTAPLSNATNTATVDFVNWRQAVNHQISEVADNTNKHMLGWLYTGTDTLNSTVAKFMDEVNTEINKTLGDTIFYSPVSAVVGCVIGNKVQTIEKGLGWVHNHSKISLPSVPFSLVQRVASLETNSTIYIGSKLDKVIKSLDHQLQTQAIVSGIFIGVWLLVAIGAGIYVLCGVQTEEPEQIPWSVTSEKMFDEIRSPNRNRITQFFVGPERRVRSQAMYVPSPDYKAQE